MLKESNRVADFLAKLAGWLNLLPDVIEDLVTKDFSRVLPPYYEALFLPKKYQKHMGPKIMWMYL